MRLSVRHRILAAQLVPLLPMMLVGLVAVVALLRMTWVVHETRTLGLQRMEAMGQAIDLFREEAVLLGRFRDSGDATWAAAARERSTEVRDRFALLTRAGLEEDGEPSLSSHADWAALPVLLGDYERLAGLSGPPGDPAEADRAARHLLSEMLERRELLHFRLESRLSSVGNAGRATATGILAAVGLLVLLGTAGGWLLSRTLIRRLEALERGTVALAAGDFETRIELLGRGDDELSRLAAAFNRMANRIGALDRMKVDFFANISHDLKTPLTSLLEAGALLDEGVAGPLSPQQRRLVGVIKESSGRLNALVKNVLDVSRMGAHSVELQPGDAEAAIERVLEDLRLLADRKAIVLVVKSHPGLPKALVNRGMLEQVLMNLVGNAIKFSPRRSTVTIRVQAEDPELLAVEGDHALRFSVVDHGPGIPAEHRARVFDRFYQVPERDQSGTGLGLYICRGIVESHGGRIEATETPQGGTTISFTLVGAPPDAKAT